MTSKAVGSDQVYMNSILQSKPLIQSECDGLPSNTRDTIAQVGVLCPEGQFSSTQHPAYMPLHCAPYCKCMMSSAIVLCS